MRENIVLRDEYKLITPQNRLPYEKAESMMLTPDMQKTIGYILYGSLSAPIEQHVALATFLSSRHVYILPSGEEIQKATELTRYLNPNALDSGSIRQILEFAHMVSISNFFCNKSFQSWVASEEKLRAEEELNAKCGRGHNKLVMYTDVENHPLYDPITEIPPHFDNTIGPLEKTFISYEYFRLFHMNGAVGCRRKYTTEFELKDPSKDFLFIVGESIITEDDPQDHLFMEGSVQFSPQQLVSNLGIVNIRVNYRGAYLPHLICIV